MPTTSPAVQLGSTRHEAPLPPGAPFYSRLWRGWKRVGRAVGMLVSRVVTTLLYFVVVTPFAIGLKLFSDPLALKPGAPRWSPPPEPGDLDDARQGF